MKTILLLLAAASLSGCATAYENSFGCGVNPGVRCASLSQVDALIDSGKLDAASSYCDDSIGKCNVDKFTQSGGSKNVK